MTRLLASVVRCNVVLASVGAVALAIGGPCAAQSSAQGAAGTWLVAAGVTFAPWRFEIVQSGVVLTGTVRQSGGITTPAAIKNGVVRGNTISFTADSPSGGRTITFAGTMLGDSIVCTRSVDDPGGTIGGAGVFGANGAMRFTAVRSSAGAVAASAPAGASIAPPTAAGAQRWVASEGVSTPWIFDIAVANGQVTGVAGQRSANPATETISLPYQFFNGRALGDTIDFTLKYDGGARVITFHGIRHAGAIDFQRHIDVVSGGPGGNGIVGADGATTFTARLLPAGAPIPAPRPMVRAGDVPADLPKKEVAYKGYTIDISAIATAADRDSVLDGVRGQLDLVDGVGLADEALRFMKSVPLVLAATTGSAAYGNGRVIIPIHSSAPFDKTHPVLLHELCHAYHDKRLPDGYRNADVLALYDAARRGGKFPADSYMVSKPAEYFAMMASVYLYGTAARDPFTRGAIKEKQPEMYAFLVKTFGAR